MANSNGYWASGSVNFDTNSAGVAGRPNTDNNFRLVAQRKHYEDMRPPALQ